MKGNGAMGKTFQKRENPYNFKAHVSNPKVILSKRGLLEKEANPKGTLVESPKEHVSIVMKWDIIPKIAPNPNRAMGVLR